MNLILFEERRDRYTIPVSDQRFEHVRGILRMKTGDSFMVGAVNDVRGDARIEKMDQDSMEISVIWDPEPMSALPPIDLVIAIPRPATARKVLFDATTLGVRSMHFFNAEKGDPAYQKSSLWTEDKWSSHVFLGAEQAFNTHLPKVTHSDSLQNALQQIEHIPHRAALDVYEATSAFSSLGTETPLAIAIGGERGWSAKEREVLRDKDFAFFSLGDRVLRVETAVNAALAIALAKIGQM